MPSDYDWSYTTKENIDIHFRPISPLDEDKLRRFFYGLRKQDVYYRFMGYVRTMDHKAALPLVVMDYAEKYAMVGYVGEQPHEELVAVGRWFLDRTTNRAEVAFTVSPDYQQKGIGTFILNKLIELGKERGLRGFTAEVLAENRQMMKLFLNSGYNVKTSLEYGVYSVEFDFDTVSQFNPFY